MKTLRIFAIIFVTLLLSSCKKDTAQKTLLKPGASKNTLLGKLIGSGGNFVASTNCNLSVSVTKDLQVDFGAVGDGITDDSKAFLQAADWINTNWSSTSTIQLYIPTGVYRVGVQLAPNTSLSYPGGVLNNPSTGPSLQGFDMLKLNGAENVVIYGDAGMASQILYKNNLSFGGMLVGGSPCSYAPGCNTCGSNNRYATVGNFISLTNCHCITIDQLSIDGNAQNCSLKGKFGECNGYQLAYDAVNIVNGSDITVSNTDCINFGRDGIMTRYTASNPTNITLTNVNCSANCRQGLSFTAGDNLVATNCKFNNSGSIFYNNPGCGLDIEPESGGICANSAFINCEFKHNAFVGMISDNHYPNVYNIFFDGCEFYASLPGTWSIWPNTMSGTVFSNCTIRGKFTHVAGNSLSDPVVFNSCLITDFDGSFSNPVSGWNQYLMDFGASMPENHFYSFIGNTFEIHHSLLIATASSGGASHAERWWEGNQFFFDYADMQSSVTYFGSTIPVVPFVSLGNFINGKLTGNIFTEVSPVSTLPANNSCYWVGICLGSCAANKNSTSGGWNAFPQDGIGGNPYTRVCINAIWPISFNWGRGSF